ncbi:MAG TPA: DUF3810 domain-containing protein [Chitinophagaceae bacterium]|nr:DUF3810 domain-containing protein [Chitinophagaceae bacterium]
MVSKSNRLILLLAIGTAIRVFAFFPEAVEKYYTHGIYPVVSIIQRFLFGWVPFSVGDLLYAWAVLYLIRGVVLMIRRIARKEARTEYWLRVWRRIAFTVVWIYILFNGLWGLNYNRVGIARQLDLLVTSYTTEELAMLVNASIDQLHQLDTMALARRDALYKKRVLFGQAIAAYEKVQPTLPFLRYRRPSVKPSLYSYLGNYLGYTGYYNPFSGEAQVNTTVPMTQQPFTTSHEIGHQLGFAKENEANFVGYLVARDSDDPAVRYSVYFDLYIYAARNLAVRDSSLAKSLHARLPELAKQDLRALRDFYKKYENPFEPIIRILYGQYLKANEQPQGILSYDEVVAWVIAYYRKYGRI